LPIGNNIGIDDASDDTPTKDQQRYRHAMKVLTREEKGGRTLVDLYTTKQKVYTEAVSAKTRAFADALKLAEANPSNDTQEKKRLEYDRWIEENARVYSNSIQAAYMDWVITGKKEEVEYWFSVVDQDTALARVEQSKVSHSGISPYWFLT
jgi:hypothetical protein